MKGYLLNPTLKLQRVGEDFELSWEDPKSGARRRQKATATDLLALKLVIEELDLQEVSQAERVPLSLLKGALERGVAEGYLQREPSRVVRSGGAYARAWFPEEGFRQAEVFVLQWHLTQRCDLSCRHCYDRSDRRPLGFREALRILDEFWSFCEELRVHGQISFSGGNPFLHPHFFEIYREARDRGFTLAVLGNPVPEAWLEKLLKLEAPAYYQISLEGLKDYNDYIRGPGHFERSLLFLESLRKFGIPSGVMLTLHEGNLDQVLPLAERLTGQADSFTFNRLALTGEGRKLLPATKERFWALLKDFWEASRRLEHLHLKDNLFNRLLYPEEVCGGCTGYGCGAAFNFVALLPDGEVHACRKFPSYLGNVFEQGLLDIYSSREAQRYREGSQACRDCKLYAVCRGCLAVTATYGLDPFRDRDPFCPGPVT